MAKFNTRSAGIKVVNRAGGEAYDLDTKTKLVGLVLTSMVNNQFYRSAGESLDELTNLIKSEPDRLFSAKLALYARNTYGLRSISHAVAGELANLVHGEPWLKRFFHKVARRPDDVTEILAYYLSKYSGRGKPTNAMKKGLGMALSGYDAYKLGKYQGRQNKISLRDAVNLCHPAHTPQLGQLINGELKAPDTWEVGLTKAGQDAKGDDDKAERKKAAWSDLIVSRKLGYFALLRNLRNIENDAPEALPLALSMLVDEKLIRKSMVLPFRFMTAFDNVSNRNTLAALSVALDISVANVPKFDGRTLVAVDVSGSMTWTALAVLGGKEIRSKPAIKYASVLAGALYKSNDADILLFDGRGRYMSADPLSSAMSIAKQIELQATGGSTNFNEIFVRASRAYDRFVILSDMQAWVGYNTPRAAYDSYRKRFDASPHIHCVDLSGYGSAQFPEHQVYQTFGFSEKVFDVMALLETDRKALIKTIEGVII